MADSQNSISQKIPKGFCQCGCNQKTSIYKESHPARMMIKGEPANFIQGHHTKIRNLSGKLHPQWKGGKRLTAKGYILIWCPGHHRSNCQGYVFEHILVAEQILGKPLPPNAEIHHVNEDKSDNRLGNIVICSDNDYHHLIHQRLRAYKACGHANWRKCNFCKQWDAPENMHVTSSYAHHLACRRAYYRAFYRTHYQKIKSSIV